MADKVTTTSSGAASVTTKKAATKEETLNDKIQSLSEQLRDALIESGRDAGTVDAQMYALRTTEENVVGNLADLQRMGALAAEGSDSSMAAAQGAAPSAPAPPEG